MEVVFVVEREESGWFVASSLGEKLNIFTEAPDAERLRAEVRDAVRASFDADQLPEKIRLLWVSKDEVLPLVAEG